MTTSSNSFSRKVIPPALVLVAWNGDNLTSDYFDYSIPSGQFGGQPFGDDSGEFGGIRHFAKQNTA